MEFWQYAKNLDAFLKAIFVLLRSFALAALALKLLSKNGIVSNRFYVYFNKLALLIYVYISLCLVLPLAIL